MSRSIGIGSKNFAERRMDSLFALLSARVEDPRRARSPFYSCSRSSNYTPFFVLQTNFRELQELGSLSVHALRLSLDLFNTFGRIQPRPLSIHMNASHLGSNLCDLCVLRGEKSSQSTTPNTATKCAAAARITKICQTS